MKKGILAFLALAFAFSVSYAAERYKDRMFEVNVEKDVVYATDVLHLSKYSAITRLMVALGKTESAIYLYENETDLAPVDLHMDVYTPKKDSEKKRAAVLVMHGGAFAAGNKADTNQISITYCDSLAARGFVAIAVQYRLGIASTIGDGLLQIDSLDFSRSVYRGIQDVRTAVRYVRSHADELGVDKDRIYLLGNSAGAILALENIYMDKASEVPEATNSEPALGVLDSYGELGEESEANAVVALWGAVHDPSIIEDTETPVLLVHGKADSTVLFKTGRPLRNIASTLGVNMVQMSLLGVDSLCVETPTLYGSFVIDSVLKAKKIDHETYFVDDMPHEFYDEDGYDTKVQDKVFGFLYGLTQKAATVRVVGVLASQVSKLRMGEGNRSFVYAGERSARYAVTDLRGRVVMDGYVSAGELVDLNRLDRGVYVLRVKGERPLRFGLVK